MEASAFTNTAIWAPNPKGKRAQRVKWALKPSADGSENIVAYGVQKALIVRDLNNPKNTKVWAKGNPHDITCAKYSPSGSYIAYGDERGGVKVVGWNNNENTFMVKYENENLLGGTVLDIAWTEDNQKIVAVGDGATRAKAINIDTKSACGELAGHSKCLLTVDVKTTRPFKCVLTGQDMEIQVYKGPPFKPEKSIAAAHTGFVNKCGFTPWDEGAHFMTVSADKFIKVYSTETYEFLFEQGGLHTMGINDFVFTSTPWEIATCSSDRSVKVWKIDIEAKTVTEVRALALHDDDIAAYKDNVDKQILAVAAHKSGDILGLNLLSDINVWKQGETQPGQVIRGHRSTVNAIGNFANQTVVSGDSEGRIFAWDPSTGVASRSVSQFQSKLGISSIAANSKFVYTGCEGAQMQQFTVEDGRLKPVHDAFITKGYSVREIHANENVVIVLFNDFSIEVLNANDINEVIARREKGPLGSNKADLVDTTVLDARSEIWCADNKGFVHVLNMNTLEPVETPEIKTEYGYPGNCIGSSSDGNWVSVGDTKGTVTLFEAENRTKKYYVKAHKNKSMNIKFTPDNQFMCSLGMDKMFMMYSVENEKSKRQLVAGEQGIEVRTFDFFNHDGINKLYFGGTASSIYEWTY